LECARFSAAFTRESSGELRPESLDVCVILGDLLRVESVPGGRTSLDNLTKFPCLHILAPMQPKQKVRWLHLAEVNWELGKRNQAFRHISDIVQSGQAPGEVTVIGRWLHVRCQLNECDEEAEC
jgi:hypothetical protein